MSNSVEKTKSSLVFDTISGIYSLFYTRQKKAFKAAIELVKSEFDIAQFYNGIDIGCGTGALCSVLSAVGVKMTGVDNSKKMLNIARKKSAQNIDFIYHNALNPLPFNDDSFDFSIASYVAHGLTPPERKTLLNKMKRVSRSYVILHEFGKQRKITTDIIEYLEGGNYFTFIKKIEHELDDLFESFKIVASGKNSLWYICTV